MACLNKYTVPCNVDKVVGKVISKKMYGRYIKKTT